MDDSNNGIPVRPFGPNPGKSEEWMGKMTKVCTHGRDRELALRMLRNRFWPLQQNLELARGFQPLSATATQQL